MHIRCNLVITTIMKQRCDQICTLLLPQCSLGWRAGSKLFCSDCSNTLLWLSFPIHTMRYIYQNLCIRIGGQNLHVKIKKQLKRQLKDVLQGWKRGLIWEMKPWWNSNLISFFDLFDHLKRVLTWCISSEYCFCPTTTSKHPSSTFQDKIALCPLSNFSAFTGLDRRFGK